MDVLDNPFFYTTLVLGVGCLVLFLGLIADEPKKTQSEPQALFLHLKTGTYYIKVGTAINTTNKVAGQGLILYHSVRNSKTLYAREESEFADKFKALQEMSHVT